LTPSAPSRVRPPMLILVKSLYVPLSRAVTPTLGGGCLIVDLDPETLDEFLGGFAVQGAVRQPFLIKRVQVLIQVPRTHGVPAV